MSAVFELTVLSENFVVCRLEHSMPMPVWALESSSFISVTRTEDELSIIFGEQQVPQHHADPTRWRALKVHGPFPLDTIGVMSELSRSLAAAKVSLLAISTHDTDYLFVRANDLGHAVRALRHDGHTVHTP